MCSQGIDTHAKLVSNALAMFSVKDYSYLGLLFVCILTVCEFPLAISAMTYSKRERMCKSKAHVLSVSGLSVIPIIPPGARPYRMKVVSIDMSLHVPFQTAGYMMHCVLSFHELWELVLHQAFN